ncbi:hypothetical protein OHA72_03730 [Dactylosporangium sp. NBC_01737]|uniref:hypothetical protein n=1 Tax=Dactylosporangium sp. NBC_01737 TaxID=2975959 RepID=UPI002E12E54F|nr:hypothetical protein OHA72_03730 [Dactylosporangium sp. NBC_01737]
MIEDALREAFAAKAGTEPPTSLDGIADVAIRNAGRVRRRRRVTAAGFAVFIVMAVAAVATFRGITPGGPAGTVAQPDLGTQTSEPKATSNTQTAPPAAAREVDAIDGQGQQSQTVRLKLPDDGTVAAAYKAKDGYLVVNTEPDGDKQLVLQDEHDNQKVLVDKASNIAVAKDGKKVAWAQEGKMTIAARTTKPATTTNATKAASADEGLTEQATIDVPQTAVPVTFVGSDLVIGREEGAGFDVWYTGRTYKESWDATVVRIFGTHPDTRSVYAEVKPADGDAPMCLAMLTLGQPFKVEQRRCGLPVAAKTGGRVSPDGHWLAYPVEGLKQVAVLDLTKIFTDAVAKVWSKTWSLKVSTKTVWMNATTFVVDSGGKFRAIIPTATEGTSEPLVESEGVVLIEPLYSG